jgi:hypothetical protein
VKQENSNQKGQSSRWKGIPEMPVSRETDHLLFATAALMFVEADSMFHVKRDDLMSLFGESQRNAQNIRFT